MIHGASLLDITPTLLQIYDLPVGEDMDGKVLSGIFKENVEPNYINSWDNESTKINQEVDYKIEPSAHEEMIKQLVDLGYVNPMNTDHEKQVKLAHEDCQFNLARSYMEARCFKEAVEILSPLALENLHVPRYTYFLASAYQALGRLEDCRLCVNRLRALTFYKPLALDVMESSLLMGERKFKEALELLKKTATQLTDSHARLHLKIAQCYMALGLNEQAEKAINVELENDYEFALAHQLQGLLYYKSDQFEACCASMMRAISLDYEMEMAHFYLGLGLMSLGEYEKSAVALETTLVLMPENNAARNKLITLYKTYLLKPELAAKHQQNLQKKLKEKVYVVSGLPRSGTSMMMQMLQAGGLELFSDGKRIADENNPNGYYEHDIVKSIATQKGWLHDAENRVVKIVANHLCNLPANRKYKVIFMDRDIHEVMSSQEKMLKQLGKKPSKLFPLKLMNALEASRRKAIEWAKQEQNVDLLVVYYAEVIENPFEQALLITDFLEDQVEPEGLVKAIDSKLYREQSIKSHV